MPAPSPLLLRFVEDELARAPALGEQVLQTVIDRSQAASAPRSALERQLEHDVVRSLAQYRPAVVKRFAEALREQAQTELEKMGRTPQPAAKGLAPAPKLMLSLLDDDEVLADVELSRTVEAINNVAEYELRELRAFTAALIGDENVAGEANPLHAETYANALWGAARALPLSREHHLAFMRLAAMPLAQSLRLACAAACTRLESQGIEPSMYRTIVQATGSRVVRAAREEPPATDLHDLLDSMPVPLDAPTSKSPPLEEVLLRADEMLRLLPDSAGPRTRQQALDAQHAKLLGSAASRVDQQMIELLSRLFDAILSDPRVQPAVQVLLSRLHGSVLRVALREPATLDTYSHPVWLFMDRLAFQSEIHGGEHDPALGESLRHAQTLIDHIVREPVQDAALYHWAVQRLQAHEQDRFETSLQAASTKIQMLERFGGSGKPAAASRPAAPPALDVGSMDTVPADLLDSGEPAPDAAAEWLRECPPGQWLQIFLQGHWRTVQLLWRSSGGDIWLLADAAGDNLTWAVRDVAIEHLYGEQLLLPLAPRSLVQRAANRVLRDMIAPHAAA